MSQGALSLTTNYPKIPISHTFRPLPVIHISNPPCGKLGFEVVDQRSGSLSPGKTQLKVGRKCGVGAGKLVSFPLSSRREGGRKSKVGPQPSSLGGEGGLRARDQKTREFSGDY